ncbi:DUF3040 domain-containing protein [Streptomyces roseus]|uniref:DUF3040 domain-containing protein n=1 Tax=Streptomyces roseus TaxID=66430 RepID=A0A0J6XJV4_9ACTN|nr:DUF3040 domain-containing protein [Streptomyces roseus]KMO95479.1 hypothetical protein ACS04_23490 [Streptomyces roseus]
MDGAGLSDQERRALSAIEADLRADRSLQRILRAARTRPRHRALAACLLAGVTLALLVAAAVTVSLPLIWGFAAAWTLTVVLALPLVGRWIRRRWQRHEHAGRL